MNMIFFWDYLLDDGHPLANVPILTIETFHAFLFWGLSVLSSHLFKLFGSSLANIAKLHDFWFPWGEPNLIPASGKLWWWQNPRSLVEPLGSTSSWLVLGPRRKDGFFRPWSCQLFESSKFEIGEHIPSYSPCCLSWSRAFLAFSADFFRFNC